MHIGGPNSYLPLPIESTLTWGLCFSCLAVSGYHYGKSILLSSGWCYNIYRRARIVVRGLFGGLIGRRRYHYPLQDSALADHGDDATWIPLTTHSRSELERASPWERYLSLLRLFEKCHPEVLTPLSVPTKNGYSRERALSNMDSFEELKCHANASLIHVLRTDDICRRLASLAMRPYDPSKWPKIHGVHQQQREQYPHTTTTLLRQFPHNRLLQRMSIFWKYLLVLPSIEEVKSFYHLPTSPVTPVAVSRNKKHVNDCNYPYRISLILPAYREKGSHLLKKLIKALKLAQDPNEVEVVVVDAGGCSDLELLLPLTGNGNESIDKDNDDVNFKPSFGRLSIFSYKSGGGRGPCLNFGAHVATGRILTFCHSDTTMPEHWDAKIVNTLDSNDDRRKRVNSCAFSFGVDTSPEGLSMPFESSTSSSATYCPRGIRALEFFTNVRNYLFSLPYGDQVLSLHACVFHFIGGYPDQCLMEDYDLVSLLRRRAALFTPPYNSSSGDIVQERLAIIAGAPALCSPRRWQKHGVLYVTFMNYKFVNMYAGRRKTSPDDLFKLYYGSGAPKREAVESPWEVELKKIMNEHSSE